MFVFGTETRSPPVGGVLETSLCFVVDLEASIENNESTGAEFYQKQAMADGGLTLG